MLIRPFSVHALEEGTDTIGVYSISEVIIEKSRNSFFLEDKKVSLPDSLTRKAFAGSDIGELLGLFSAAYINTPGSRGASSSSFLRGTSSYQTAVSWNGFTLNSLTLGTMDLSLLPSGAFSNVSVVHGASGSLAGSGNMGGSVLLDNGANWNERLRAGVASEFGTYGSRNYSFSGNIGNPRLQYQLHLFSQQAENSFRFTDTFKHGDPAATITNNSLDNKGLMHNLFIRLPGNHKLEAGMWYQVKEKEIPAIMGSYLPANTVQNDSLLRMYAKWSVFRNNSSLTVNTAFFDEQMVYRDRNLRDDGHYMTDSRIRSSRWINDINYRNYLADFLSADAGVSFSALSAHAGAYGEKAGEYQVAAVSAAKLTLPGFVSNLSVRKEFHSSTQIPVLFAIGARKDLPFRGMALKASYSDQFRVPSFNDKYWQPGGNPDLLPEYGYSGEIGLTHYMVTGKGTEISAEVNAYKSRLNDMIMWVPAENNSWWYPENREKADIRGIEASGSANGNSGVINYSTGFSYNYARSVTQGPDGADDERRLIYVPGHAGSAYLNVWINRFFAGMNLRHNGSRYTTADNNPALKMPSFTVFKSYAGFNIRIGDMNGRLQLMVRNLFNSRYQVVRSYPMPGRTFHLGFSLEFRRN